MTKEEIKNLKKTIEAHGTFSEEETKKKSEKQEDTKAMLKKENGKSKEVEIKDKKEWMGKRESLEAVIGWDPKTKLGNMVKNGEIKNIDDILDKKIKILEPEIVDMLIEVKSDLISIGQFKGKFGGGKRRAWRQTQKKTKEGNIPTFSTMAVIGDGDGHVGVGSGRAAETVPAREKATRKAKLNVIKVGRTCSAFDCSCSEKHTIPFKVSGKSGSARVTLIPAPQGTGLVAGNELKKILDMAGIKDVYTKTFGKKRTTFNVVKACIKALKQTTGEKK